MKQTAVEWLIHILEGQQDKPFTFGEWMIAFEHAKEIEKEQITEAFKNGIAYWNGDEWKLIDITNYYIETFNKK